MTNSAYAFSEERIRRVGAAKDGALALIADDDRTNRLVLQDLLGRAGYRFVVACNGVEAIEVFERERPDVILMDVMMPEINGLDAARQIKLISGDDFVPIIFLTTITEEHGLVECIEAGGDDFLNKPYSHVLLKAKLDAALRTRMLYQALKSDRDKLDLLSQQHLEELKLAEKIYANHARQESHLPIENLRYLIEGVDVMNGDVILAAEMPSGGQLFLLGDFTGHGLPAAVGAMVVFDVFYAMTAKGFGLLEVVKEINRKLRMTLPVGRFMAACALELSPMRDRAVVWNGGIPDVLVWSSGQGLKARLPSTQLPLGVLENDQIDLAVQHVELERGDQLVVCSDGYIEAKDGFDQMLGSARLVDTVVNAPANADLFKILVELLRGFRGCANRSDDVTLMVINAELADDDAAANGAPALFSKEPMDWHYTLELGATALRQCDPLPGLLQAVDEIQGLGGVRARLFTILAELFSNALEHGLLGIDSRMKSAPGGFAEYYAERERRLENLDSGTIRLELEHSREGQAYELVIRLVHDGAAFNPEVLLQELTANRSASGRGIELIKSLSDSLSYSSDGRSVEVRLRTTPEADSDVLSG